MVSLARARSGPSEARCDELASLASSLMQVLVNMAVDGYIRTTLLAIFITSDEVVGCSALYMVTNHPSSPVELNRCRRLRRLACPARPSPCYIANIAVCEFGEGVARLARRAADCSLLSLQLALLPGFLRHRKLTSLRTATPAVFFFASLPREVSQRARGVTR